MTEEGGSLLASYAIKHSALSFDKKIGDGSMFVCKCVELMGDCDFTT